MGGAASVTTVKDHSNGLEKTGLVREKTALMEDPSPAETNPFPQFKSYTAARLTRDEIQLITESRMIINSVPAFLEFDNIFFRALHDSCPLLQLSNRPFTVKKQFTMQLMALIAQDCGFYRQFVSAFVTRYMQQGVARQDYEVIGELFVWSVGALHGDGSERLLWAKAYSAFLRVVAEVNSIDFDGQQ